MAVTQSVPPYRLSIDDVMGMVRAGVLAEETRIELEGGVLLQMVPPGEGHEERVEWISRFFVKAAGDEVRVRVQAVLELPDGGLYLPDLLVFESKDEGLPRTGRLVVEIAVTSLARDLEKVANYAAANVEEYWIVDIAGGEVLVHSEPRADGYAVRRRYLPGEQITPPVAVPPVDVTALLGR